MSTPEWMPIAQSYTGIREIKGKKHNPEIVKFFHAVGHREINDDETAWCAAFVGACLEEAGYKSTGSLAARSYLSWGKKITKPVYGCIVVFKRGSSSWEGHVAFYVREDENYIYVLGGNQADQVNVSRYSKSSLLGYRMPSTMSNSRTVVAVTTNAVSTGAAATTEVLQQTQETLMGIPLDIAKYLLVAISLASLGVILWARWDDLVRKGR